MCSENGDIVIRTRGLGKRFRLFHAPSQRLMAMMPWKKLRGIGEVWAVRSVDLDIRRGETVGIVGRNGSGKSTLLEMICGTLHPTEGGVEVNGRVAALLQLGAGFNPEFTGRENIYFNASVLGLDRQTIDERYDEIVDFADIGGYIDQPIKTYSSGMYARLAFAVAINVDADVLVVDEALSVGDEAFQRKCFGRLAQLREGGTTILFVSHAASTVTSLCDRAVLLHHGERLMTGGPRRVVAEYQRLLYTEPERVEQVADTIRELDRTGEDAGEAQAVQPADGATGGGRELPESTPDELVRTPARPRWTTNTAPVARLDTALQSRSEVVYSELGARIEDIHLETEQGERVNVLVNGYVYVYRYRVRFDRVLTHLRFGMMIKTVSGIEIAGQVSHAPGTGLETVGGGDVLDVEFRFRAELNPGSYFVSAGVVTFHDGAEHFLHRRVDAVALRVEPFDDNRVTGLCSLAGEPACRIVASAKAEPDTIGPGRKSVSPTGYSL